MIDYESTVWTRFYAETNKTIAQCASHGADHRAYQWSPQIDPRWTAEQKAAYITAYEGKGV